MSSESNPILGRQLAEEGNLCTPTGVYREEIAAADADVDAFDEEIDCIDSRWGVDNRLAVWVECTDPGCNWEVEVWLRNPVTEVWHRYVREDGVGTEVFMVRYLLASRIKLLVSNISAGQITLYENHSI